MAENWGVYSMDSTAAGVKAEITGEKRLENKTYSDNQKGRPKAYPNKLKYSNFGYSEQMFDFGPNSNCT